MWRVKDIFDFTEPVNDGQSGGWFFDWRSFLTKVALPFWINKAETHDQLEGLPTLGEVMPVEQRNDHKEELISRCRVEGCNRVFTSSDGVDFCPGHSHCQDMGSFCQPGKRNCHDDRCFRRFIPLDKDDIFCRGKHLCQHPEGCDKHAQKTTDFCKKHGGGMWL